MFEPELVDRQRTIEDLERSRRVFHALITGASKTELRGPSLGTRWTNEELLFHMLFGFIIVRALMIIVRVFGRLPDRVSQVFARLLNAATVPFHAVNYLGSCVGSRIFNHRRMGAKFDKTLDAIERSLSRETEEDLHGSMHYPMRWDPYFKDRMTLEDIYRYPVLHFDHHAEQLTLTSHS